MNGFIKYGVAVTTALALIFSVLPYGQMCRIQACPFCLAPPETWTETLARADVILVGEVVAQHLFPQQIKVDVSAETVFRIRRVLKGPAGSFQEGRCLTIQEFVTPAPGELFLLTGQQNISEGLIGKPGSSRPVPIFMLPELIEWSSPAAMNSDLLKYIAEAPAASLPPDVRLPYFLPFLESADAEIASDAWGEFARSRYEDVVSVRREFSTDRLRSWIANPSTSPERLGLYGMMLGLCGDQMDAAFLEQQIGMPRRSQEFRFGSEGLMGGYLLLTGESGLNFLRETRLQPGDIATDEVFSVIQAIQFIWSYEPEKISRDSLRRSLHVLLNNEQMREVVITDLARWRDWDTAPQLIGMFESLESTDERSQKAIVAFMIAATRCTGEEQATPEVLQMAEVFLQDIGHRYPVILQAAQREFGPIR